MKRLPDLPTNELVACGKEILNFRAAPCNRKHLFQYANEILTEHDISEEDRLNIAESEVLLQVLAKFINMYN